MKNLFINTPSRDAATTYPPFACLSLMNYLRKHGETDLDFYNIDFERPSLEKAVDRIVQIEPGLLSISAVVSTSYEFVKKITLSLKSRLPNVTIILGGNMGVSAEILLRKTGVDVVALGEGEIILLNFVQSLKATGDYLGFSNIKGLVFINRDGVIINTGYEKSLPSDQIYDFLWDDLSNSLDHYIFDIFEGEENKIEFFAYDKRSYEPHRKRKKYATFIVGKGCVARCTFCHRWDKGIRHIPVPILMERLDYLVNMYNVGFVNIVIEAFGIDKKWLDEFCKEIKKREILWSVGGVRAKSVTQKVIMEMKEAGCTTIIYGLESGSQTILDIMEKKTELQENINAHRWTVEAGFYGTFVQFVLGMPGESPKTIKETINFAKYCFTLNRHLNPNNFSLNFAQALPGTPLYEYGRQNDLIGVSIDDEEKYLIKVSDTNASDYVNTLNFTGYPALEFWSWRYKIRVETSMAYIRKFGLSCYNHVIKDPKDSIFFNSEVDTYRDKKPGILDLILRRDLRNILTFYPHFLYYIRFLIPILLFLVNFNVLGSKQSFRHLFEYMKYLALGVKKSSLKQNEKRSLRKIVNEDYKVFDTDLPELLPLRKGR